MPRENGFPRLRKSGKASREGDPHEKPHGSHKDGREEDFHKERKPETCLQERGHGEQKDQNENPDAHDRHQDFDPSFQTKGLARQASHP